MSDHALYRHAASARLAFFLLLMIVSLFVGQAARANAVDNLAPGHWYQVPDSKMLKVAPKPPPPGVVGPRAVVKAWSGGAFDTKRHRMVVWGGGHADYSGNEVYVFDVNSLKWQRLTDPSRNVGGDISTGLYPDGRPRSAHSYNSLQYLANIDRLAVFGLTATYRSSGGSSKLFTFDFDTLKWSHSRAKMPSGTGGYDALSAYNPKTGLAWVDGSGHGELYSYNPVKDQWNGPYVHTNTALYMTAAIDSKRNLLVEIGGGAYRLKDQATLFNLDNPSKPIDLKKRTKGPKKIESAVAPGFAFDSEANVFVGWSGGSNVYVLDPKNWTWYRIYPSAGSPVVPPEGNPRGTYGRFRYVPSKNAFILVNGADQDVYFYKLPKNLAQAEKRGEKSIASSSDRVKRVSEATETLQTESTDRKNASSVTSFAVVSESDRVQQQIPVTFGQVFRPGAVGEHDAIKVELANGSRIPAQVDRKATNADGSLRFALITAIVPKLKARSVERLYLVKSDQQKNMSSVRASDITVSALETKGFDAQVVVNWQGDKYRVDAVHLLHEDKAKLWLDGPLAKEWIVRGVPTSSDGKKQSNLGIEFYIRAYKGLKHVRVGVAFDNDWSYAAHPQNIVYDATVRVGGKVVYQKNALEQYAHTRWHGSFWWGNDPDPVPQRAVWVNTAYLQSTGAVPQYESLKPSNRALNKLLAQWSPMEHGSITKHMSAPGAQADIGLLPRWTALYLVSGDLRAKRATILNGEAGGSYSIHYEDKKTGRPLSIADYPYVSIIGNPSDMVNRATHKSEAMPKCSGSCDTPISADYSHMPSLAYVPYLVTGDYYFLQELEYWANWHLVWMNPYYREFKAGMLFPHGTIRGQAWILRELGYAAYIVPDKDPMKDYFKRVVENNLKYLNKRYAHNAQVNNLHFLSQGGGAARYHGGTGIAPWQQDFVASSLDQLVRMDFGQARPMLSWLSKFPVGRMIAPGYCWISGAAYSLIVRDTSKSPFYTTFKQAYENTVAPPVLKTKCNSQAMAKALHLHHTGEMTGHSNEPTGYPSNMQPALAAAVDVSAPGATQAWKLFMSRKIKPNYADYPNFAMVPGDAGR